jgi:hypothetical protein
VGGGRWEVGGGSAPRFVSRVVSLPCCQRLPHRSRITLSGGAHESDTPCHTPGELRCSHRSVLDVFLAHLPLTMMHQRS